jgi:hypothetical protein
VGSLLRPYSLDELPQLWNVLRGDMALIGPRPERLSYVERFSPAIYRYAERHRVKPGLTGWAQVNGLRGETSLADRVEWDNFYVENWSWKLDARIMVRTLLALRAPHPTPGEAPAIREPAAGVKRTVYKLAATLVLMALMLLAVATSHADAAGTGASAVDQYVESLPTASGPLALDPSNGGGGGSGGGSSGHSGHGVAARGLPLTSAARTQLREIDPSVAHKLTLTATTPQLGAPTRRLSPAPVKQSTPSGVNAAAKAIVDDGGGQLTWLLIVLGAITILAAGAALNDRTRGRRAD